jgi:hypothetical protein
MGWWLRLAVGGAVAVAVILMLRGRSHEMSLAKLGPEVQWHAPAPVVPPALPGTDRSVAPVQVMPPPSAAGEPVKSFGARNPSESTDKAAPAEPAISAAAPQQQGEVAKTATPPATLNFSLKQALAPAAQNGDASGIAGRPQTYSRETGVQHGAEKLTSRGQPSLAQKQGFPFVVTAGRSAVNAKSAGVSVSQRSAVLTSFQIEWTGQKVRIVDADGSVYKGQVINPAVANNAQAANQVLTFQASGMNNNLHQNVTFTGNLSNAGQNQPFMDGLTQNSMRFMGQAMSNQSQAAEKNSNSSPQQSSVSPGRNWRLNGQVKIGAGNLFDLEAVPVQP